MLKKLLESARLLKNTRVLCTCAIFVALYVILDIAQIPLTPQSRISFTFLTTALAGWLFGIVPAAIVGALGDIIGFVIHPTGAYFPGFTITAILSGTLYGMFLFRAERKNLLLRVISVKLVTMVFLNIILNTYWLSILYQKAYFVYMVSRITKNLITLPINIAVLYVVILVLMRHGIQRIYK